MDGLRILDSLSAGVLVMAPGGSITYANKGALQVLGGAVADPVGQHVADVLPPVAKLIARGGKETRGEFEVLARDGVRHIGFTLSGPSTDGTWTVLCQDITAMRELRHERDRLMQFATLGDALPSILHELRNPLAAVSNSLELLIEEASDEVRQDLAPVLWEIRRMKLTLHGVGGLFGTVHTSRETALDFAIGEACRILTWSAEPRGIRIVTDVPTLPLLPLDWGVVSGVVFNLVKNAIDACTAGDVITVGAELRGDEAFAVKVSDTGPGMAPDVLAHCRQIFYSTKSSGSGIGLALCQRIADVSGGQLEIASAPGAGTTVILTFPLYQRAPVPRTRTGHYPPSGRTPSAGT